MDDGYSPTHSFGRWGMGRGVTIPYPLRHLSIDAHERKDVQIYSRFICMILLLHACESLQASSLGRLACMKRESGRGISEELAEENDICWPMNER